MCGGSRVLLLKEEPAARRIFFPLGLMVPLIYTHVYAARKKKTDENSLSSFTVTYRELHCPVVLSHSFPKLL